MRVIKVRGRLEFQLPLIAIGTVIVVACVSSFTVGQYRTCNGTVAGGTSYNSLLFWTSTIVMVHMFLASLGVHFTLGVKSFWDCLPSAAISAFAMAVLIIVLGVTQGYQDIRFDGDTGSSCKSLAPKDQSSDKYVISLGASLAVLSFILFWWVKNYVQRGGDGNSFGNAF